MLYAAALTSQLWFCGTVQQRQASSLRRLPQEECHRNKEPVEDSALLHA